MHKIYYDIELNENGRPCIALPDEYEQKPEDKFFAIEIARYYLQMVAANMDESIYDQNTFDVMDETIRMLGQIGDEMAVIQYDMMRSQGEISMMMEKRYHVMVESIEERDALPDKDIVYNGKIFDRDEGLRVCVQQDKEDGTWEYEHYELQNGITNENWVKL